MLTRIHGKTVLITGGSSGIGEACAQEFAKYGCRLILAARRVERLEALKEQLQAKYNLDIFVVGMDVTHAKQVATVVNHLPKEFATIDILVNNAGLALGLNNLVDDDPKNWDTMIDTNLKGFLTVLRLISRKMVERGCGHIINIGSIAGIETCVKSAVYCATKHAVHAVTQSLREELIEHGIRVSEVLPGQAETEFTQVRFNGDEKSAKEFYHGFIPLKAEDIAEIIVYIANAPQHVNMAETLVLPSAQAKIRTIYRK